MSYEKRIAQDWIETYSGEDSQDLSHDPLLFIELIVQCHWAFGWGVLEKILDTDVSGGSLPMLVAGPFDSWVKRHADKHADFLEFQAKASPRLRWALGGISQGSLHESTWQIIVNVRRPVWMDGQFPPPAPPVVN